MASVIKNLGIFVLAGAVHFATHAQSVTISGPPDAPQTTPGKPFRGKIVYKGTYSLQTDAGAPAAPSPSQLPNIQIGGFSLPLGQLAKQVQPTPMQTFNGAITIELEVDGNAVNGAYKSTGVLNSGRWSGVVNNGNCELAENGGGNSSRILARCDQSVFSGNGVNLPGSRQKVDISYQATVAEVINYDERDRKAEDASRASRAKREKEEAASKAANAAEMARQEELLKSLPPVPKQTNKR